MGAASIASIGSWRVWPPISGRGARSAYAYWASNLQTRSKQATPIFCMPTLCRQAYDAALKERNESEQELINMATASLNAYHDLAEVAKSWRKYFIGSCP